MRIVTIEEHVSFPEMTKLIPEEILLTFGQSPAMQKIAPKLADISNERLTSMDDGISMQVLSVDSFDANLLSPEEGPAFAFQYNNLIAEKIADYPDRFTAFANLPLTAPLAAADELERAAARRTEKMQDLKNYGIKPITLDVTKDESVTACVEQIFKEVGSIEVLVNNAGFGLEGAIEDVTMQDAKYQLEVNVFGAMHLTQLVLPKMRQNNYGKIVNISSVNGKFSFPMGGWYGASKFAIN